jgi:hypothetical protein
MLVMDAICDGFLVLLNYVALLGQPSRKQGQGGRIFVQISSQSIQSESQTYIHTVAKREENAEEAIAVKKERRVLL